MRLVLSCQAHKDTKIEDATNSILLARDNIELIESAHRRPTVIGLSTIGCPDSLAELGELDSTPPAGMPELLNLVGGNSL